MPFLKRSESIYEERTADFHTRYNKGRGSTKNACTCMRCGHVRNLKLRKFFLACFHSFVRKFAPTKISRCTVPYTVNFRLVVQKRNIEFQTDQSRSAKLPNLLNAIGQFMFQYCVTCSGNFRFVVRSIFAHAQISITTETLQPPWLTETQGDGWVSGTFGRDMPANPLQALIMHSLRMFISVHKGACA